MGRLSHIDEAGAAAMVDVGAKPITHRVAIAEALVEISADLARAVRDNTLKKGDLLAVARIAGIQAAKRTDELIPLCHSLPLDAVDVKLELSEAGATQQTIRIVTTASTHARTGVEMEALTAASVAALTVIDMGKAIDKAIVVRSLRLLEKRGGRSGTFIADAKA
ncbi:MAG: cyclic pyranopterin monophosphate synthase MoaC [Planctomycetota bacterium]|nr:cyclic pyranopterin monophosphate synthase MoaC [Planctomycetota bacterium]